MSFELNRREAIFFIAASSAAAGFELLSHYSGDNFEESIVDATGVNTQSPYDLAKSFAQAPTPTLMFMYSMFFPLLIKNGGRPYLNKISESANKVGEDFPHINPHRMAALPGVAAAHMLPIFLSEPKNRIGSRPDTVLSLILDGLRNTNREVNEIVLQNLTNSLPKDKLSAKYYVIDANVLEALVNLISRASSTPKLILPLTSCVNYLLNLRLAISSAQPNSTLARDVNILIDTIHRDDRRGLGYISRMIELHEHSFGKSIKFPNDGSQVSSRQIPPQLSELMIGWDKLQGNRSWKTCSPYVEHYILMRARNNFEVWKTLNGLDTAEYPAIQTVEDAARAYPKSLQMCRTYYDILLSHDIPNADTSFRLYIQKELPKLLANSDAGEKYPPFDIWLNRQVPLAKFSNTDDLFRSYKNSPLYESDDFSNVLLRVVSGLGTSISLGLSGAILYPFVRDKWLRSKSENMKSINEKDDKELATLTEEKLLNNQSKFREIKEENLDD